MGIGVLGQAAVVDGDGHAAALPSGRQRQLLAALVLRRDADSTPDQLAELVWGEDQPRDPASAVHTTVSRLRRSLPEGVEVERGPAGYRLVCPPGELDVLAVEAALAPGAGLAELDAALGAWRGEPYADLDHPDAAAERARLGEVRATLVEARAEALLAAGRHEDAVVALTPHVAEHPTREAPVATLVRALYAGGRQGDALAAYRALRERLLDELGVDPSEPLRALELAVLNQELPTPAPDPASAGPAPAAPTTSPPAPLPSPAEPPPLPISSFVGREHDLAALVALLHDQRVVTVVGPGGMGKTRLALHAADHLATGGAEVWWVPLAPLTSGDDLVGAVASALRLPDPGTGVDLAVLVGHLRGRAGLLVLDDAEHVLDAAAGLVEHLAGASGDLRVLVTSRSPLGVDGEHRFALGALEPAAARRLFFDRARATDRARADAADDEVVGEICTRLDGSPLAIELAASCLVGQDADSIRRGLDRRFDLLTRGRRTAPERHQSLRAVVDWSFRALDPSLRHDLLALSAFAGSFEAEDVAAVAGEAAAGRLADLVERSLLTSDPAAVPARFGLQETLRSYLREERAPPEAEADRERHTTWAIDLAERALEGMGGADEPLWIRRLDRTLADLRQAHRHLLEVGDDERRARLVADLLHWAWKGRVVEPLAWVEEAAPLQPSDPTTAARLRSAVCVVRSGRSDLGPALEAGRQAVALAAAAPSELARAHYALGDVLLFRGDLDGATEHGIASYEAAEQAGRPVDAVLAAVDVCLAAAYRGQDDEAERWAGRIADAARRSGAPSALGWAAYVDGERLAERDPRAALARLEACLATIDHDQARFLAAVCELTHVTTLGRLGETDRVFAELSRLLVGWAHDGWWTQAWTGVRALVGFLPDAGAPEDAALLVGAVHEQARRVPLFGADAERIDAARAAAREQLGEDRAAALEAEGAALEPGAAIGRAAAVARRLSSS